MDLNILQINITSDFDEYLIYTQYYEKKEVIKSIIIGGDVKKFLVVKYYQRKNIEK